MAQFYSWYIYPENEEDFGKSVSSAEYIEDVDNDSVVIIDGLTKVSTYNLLHSFAYILSLELASPWLACVLGRRTQESHHRSLAVRIFLRWWCQPPVSITTFSHRLRHPDYRRTLRMQLAAIDLVQPDRVAQEKLALQKHFKAKRDHVLKRLHDLGLDVDIPPQATFYVWLNLQNLPAPLNNGLTFFEELLKEQTIVIPGIFFDINPSHRRNLFHSPCHHFVRLSFGPPLADLDKGGLIAPFLMNCATCFNYYT